MWPECFESVIWLITRPRVTRLRLMFLASFKVWPSAPVFAIRSEPARSTRYRVPVLQEPSMLLTIMIVMMKRQCEREDASFILVDAVALFLDPFFIVSITSNALLTYLSVKSAIYTPFSGVCTIFKSSFFVFCKSFIFSL